MGLNKGNLVKNLKNKNQDIFDFIKEMKINKIHFRDDFKSAIKERPKKPSTTNTEIKSRFHQKHFW